MPLSFEDDRLLELGRCCKDLKSDEIVRKVHDAAGEKYRSTKKGKQEDLFYKIIDAQQRGDRQLLKNVKKKVDNHASAVASRVKQEFLISYFEMVIKSVKDDNSYLADVIRQKNEQCTRKDLAMESMRKQISNLLIEISQLRAMNCESTRGWPPFLFSPEEVTTDEGQENALANGENEVEYMEEGGDGATVVGLSAGPSKNDCELLEGPNDLISHRQESVREFVKASEYIDIYNLVA